MDKRVAIFLHERSNVVGFEYINGDIVSITLTCAYIFVLHWLYACGLYINAIVEVAFVETEYSFKFIGCLDGQYIEYTSKFMKYH